MSKPLPRRLAQVGGIQLSPTSDFGVWVYANAQGGGSKVSIDVHAGGGYFSLELSTVAAGQLASLLHAGGFMAEVAGDMSAEEWAIYETGEKAAAPQPAKEGGAA